MLTTLLFVRVSYPAGDVLERRSTRGRTEPRPTVGVAP